MSDSHKRAITVHFNGDHKLNIYPNEAIRGMVEADADDNIESLSKTILRILKKHYAQFPPRRRSDLK